MRFSRQISGFCTIKWHTSRKTLLDFPSTASFAKTEARAAQKPAERAKNDAEAVETAEVLVLVLVLVDPLDIVGVQLEQVLVSIAPGSADRTSQNAPKMTLDQ